METVVAPELKHHLDVVLAAIRAVDAGISEGELDAAPLMENWRVLISPGGSPVLWGKAVGHPRLGTKMITTSRLIAINHDRTVARSLSRWFRLGPPNAAVSDTARAGAGFAEKLHAQSLYHETGMWNFAPLDDLTVVDRLLSEFILQARELDDS
jgi:hypothetical protein